MSYQNFNPKLYPKDDVQFKIISQSQTYKLPLESSTNTNNLLLTQNSHHSQAINSHQLNTNEEERLSYYHKGSKQQQRVNDSIDIFNDVLEGGGVEPSINETIRESIQCSFVSSEGNQSKQMFRDLEHQTSDAQRDQCVMNRMNWITYLKVLFDQLESFNQNKQKHVENANFVKGLKKIKNLLPLLPRNEYYKNCSDVAFTYKEVENGILHMPKYLTWDMVIDVFLSKQYAQSMINNPKQKNSAVQQVDTSDNYPSPQQINDSQLSDIQYDNDDNDHSFKDKAKPKKKKLNFGSSASNDHQQNTQFKRQRNDDFFLSFADSLINHGNHTTETLNTNQQQQYMAQAPLLLGNPNLGLMDKDEDEACEIDSENSNDNEDDEENKNNFSNSRRQKSKLEESIRSSRTATFKSMRRTSTHQGTNTMQNSIPSNAFAGVSNTQDSYYAMIKNAKTSTTASQPQQTQPSYQNQQQQQLIYYQQQHQLQVQKNENSNCSSRNNQGLSDTEDGQVEVASNRSGGSATRWRTVENAAQNSVTGDIMFNYEEPNIIPNNEKSTRISSLNSIQKTANMNQNNTILSHNSSQSSQSYSKNLSKISGVSSSTGQQQQSHFVDLDLQSKGLRNFEMDFKQAYGDKKQLRSINLANNSLVKLPPSLEKSLQYMNVAYNKLKSLNGIETCVNLKFINVSGNMLSSAQSLILLQSLREVIFAYNQISHTKELGQLKNIQLLDLSHNKLIELEKLIPLQNLKKLTILSLQGNLMQTKSQCYEQQVGKILPQVKVLDPDSIRDFSQFQAMEGVCFTEEPSHILNIEQVNSNALLSQYGSNEKKQATQSDQRKRSQTPNRERSKSQLGQQQQHQQDSSKLKSTVISPKRLTIDPQLQPPVNSQQAKHQQLYEKSNTAQLPQQIQQQQQKPTSSQAKVYYNENQFKLQGKYSSSSLQQQRNNATAAGKNVGDRSTSRNKGMGVFKRERSYTNEEDKSQTRERSVSNLGNNNKAKTQLNSLAASGRSTAGAIQQTQLTSQQTNQQSVPSLKDQVVKKVQLNVNLGKTFGSQGKLTPRRNNNQTPRQEKPTHYYKKSFCQTEDESSITLHHANTNNERDLVGTPSEKNTVRTAPTQDSSNKKKGGAGLKNISKKDEITIASMNIMSPGQKIARAPLQSSRINSRPVTTLKQRVVASALQRNDQLTKDYTTIVQQQTQTNQTLLHPNAININQAPQSTKNANHSHSFIFEQPQNNIGRQTPTSNLSQNRPSSQLQKFINAKPQTQATTLNTQLPTQAQRPSQTSMLVHQMPSQKLTNLPPRAYQNKGGNPGDKKSKADMSLSVISQGHQTTTQNNTSMQHNVMNTSHNKNSSIMQTGGTMGDEESKFEEESSRSMSPVLEESNNIKKLRVDLTQFMNKQ